MTPEQLEAIMYWIKACIDKKIEDAFHRSGLQESIRERELRDDMYRTFGFAMSGSGRPFISESSKGEA